MYKPVQILLWGFKFVNVHVITGPCGKSFIYSKRGNKRLTLTSSQEVEVRSQSGHLKVLGSKCALLWFSMSERPWKDSMHIRQENLLVLRLGELTAEGEAGPSLLSWQKDNNVRNKRDPRWRRIYMPKYLLSHSYLHLLQNPIRQFWSKVVLFTFQTLWLFYSLRRTALIITVKTEALDCWDFTKVIKK